MDEGAALDPHVDDIDDVAVMRPVGKGTWDLNDAVFMVPMADVPVAPSLYGGYGQ